MLERLSPECAPSSAASSSECAMAEVVDEIAARLQQGERVDVEEYVGQYPQWAKPLRRLVPALEALAVIGNREGSGGPEGAPVQGSGEGERTREEIANCELQIANLKSWSEENIPKAQNQSPKTSSPNPKSKIQNRTCLDDFELIREVGRGGMGIVYEARQTSLDRRVAVKVLPAACLLDPRQLQRFQNEARAAAQLNHPHIVDVICVGCDGETHYFAMRFVEGRTLAEVIREGSGFRVQASGQEKAEGRRQKAEKRTAKTQDRRPKTHHLNPKSKIQNRKCAEWIAQAAEALDHAHSLGIVHRDVKPSNLIIDNDGKLWVTDFGLARFGDDAALTMTGDLLGTLRYMSPEQALGQRAAIDHRSDVYSLGATLYELLAGVPVFEGVDRSDLLRQLVFSQPRPLRKLDPSIPRDLETIALKALEKLPGDRFASAGEMAADLRRFIRGEAIRAKPPTAAQRTVKWCVRHGRLVASAALLLVLAVVGLSVSTVLIVQSSNEARLAQQTAEERDRENRRMLSAVETRLALQAYQGGDLQRTRELLDRQLPGGGIRENSGNGGNRANAASLSPIENPKSKIQNPAEDLRDFTWHWLRGAVDARFNELRSFDDNPSEVYCIDFSPDGALLAAAVRRKVIIREVATGAIRRVINSHATDTNCVKFSPDGTLLATVGDDHHVRLWHAASGELAADLGTHETHPVFAVAFSPDGRLLASGADRGWVRLWNVATHAEEKRFAHGGRVDSLIFADRGALVVVAVDGQMVAWETDTARVRWRVSGPSCAFLSLAASLNGATIAAGDHSGAVGLYSAVDGRELATFGARQTKIQSVAFSPDDRFIAVGGHDGITQLWDLTGPTYCGQTPPHRERVWCAAFSLDGRTLVTSSRDRSIKFWEVAALPQPRLLRYPGMPMPIAFSPTSQTLAFCTDEKLWLWPRAAAQPSPFSAAETHFGNALSWSNGAWMHPGFRASAYLDPGGERHRWLGHGDDKVDRLVFSGDGQWVALHYFPEGRVEIRHLPSGRLRYSYRHNPPVFTSDSSYAYFVELEDGRFRFWKLNLRDFDAAKEPIGAADRTEVLALSPDGRLLALGNHDSTIELLELATGHRRRLTGHERLVWALAFSPDGRILASSGTDGTLRLWRVDVGEMLGILERRTNGDIKHIAFSPDGRSLAASGRDGINRGVISLWEIESPDRPQSEPATVED